MLIIDDSEVDRYLLRQHLKGLPVTIAEEAAGLAGIERASGLQPDLIFLDLPCLICPASKSWMNSGGGRETTFQSRRDRNVSEFLRLRNAQRLIEYCAGILGKNNLS